MTKPQGRHFDLVILVTLIGTFSSAPAYAYVDPASGTLLAQALIGSALGAYTIAKLYLRSFIGTVRSFFKPRPPR